MNSPFLEMALAAPDRGKDPKRLVGQRSNRSGIGEVRSGSTFLSQSDFRLQFGLGSASEARAVEVQWLDGAMETVGVLKGGQIVTLTEGKGVTGVTRYIQ